MAKPWDRREGESEAAYAAFDVFLHTARMGVFSVEFALLVKEKTGFEFEPSYLGKIRTNHKWHDRKRAYQSSLLNRKMKNVTWKVTIETPLAAKGRSKLRNMVRDRTIEAVETAGKQFIDESDAKLANAYLDWLAKALNLGCLTDLDHADQLRKLSATRSADSIVEPSDTEDDIPAIQEEPGCVQLDDPEAETLLGQAESDMPGNS